MGSLTLVDRYSKDLVPRKVRFDASDALPIYIGVNVSADATDAQTDWLIYKFTYTGVNVTCIEARSGSWTGRASLAWVG
jgi:hypothetical protein